MHFKKKLTESSKSWLTRQMKDPFSKKAKLEGYRSRAAYKLIEIDKKYKIFSKNCKVIDIGSSPGGWSEVAIKICKEKKINTKIVAIDLLEMAPIEGVEFIIGNFEDETIQQKILDIIGLEKFDIILSDMAPNTSGKQSLDHLRIMNLCESVLEYTKNYLSHNGILITKIFKGSEEQKFVLELKQSFSSVKYCKPESSRKESNEIYLVCQGFKS